jgi:hypothetical protein
VSDAFATAGSLTSTQTTMAALAAGTAVAASAWLMARLLRTPMGGMNHAL